VYGGGGITPDYIIKLGSLSSYTQNLLRKNLFYTYILSYLDKNGESIKKKFNDNLPLFEKDFKVSETMLNSFNDYARSKDVTFVQEEYEKR